MKLSVLGTIRISFLAVVCLVGITSPAHSAVIVDTGPGPSGLPGNLWAFNGGDKFAGQFVLSENTSITAIQGWMGTFVNSSGLDFDVHVYSDTNGLPGPSLFSGSTSAAAPTNVPAGEQVGFDWNGLSNLNWNLAAGTYWVTFEGTNPLQSALIPGPSTNPLAHYAWNSAVTNNTWTTADYLKLGIRIDGIPSPVPVPSAIWLFGSGLLGLMRWARRQQASTQ